MKDHFKVKIGSGSEISFMASDKVSCFASISVYCDMPYVRTNFQIITDDVVALCLIRRAIEHQIAALQPGLVNSLPPGDPEEFDAMKISYEVDRLWNEGNL